MFFSRAAGVVALGMLCLGSAPGQTRKLHTRDMTRLSQPQVAAYLKRNDVIFIPVGSVETNGIMPSDRDYVEALAVAMTMAEELDALYMPGLIWSYPGTTLVAPSTVHITPSQGNAFLRATAESLLKSGFRRQVYLSMGHGPAPLTAGTMVREFFDQTHVPILYIDMDTVLTRLKVPPASRGKLLYGTHQIAGRLADIPIQGDYTEAQMRPAEAVPENTGMATLAKLGYAGSLTLGSWVPDAMAHGTAIPVLAKNAEEREEWGQQGRAIVTDIVKQMRLAEAMDALRAHDRYTNQVLVPKFGKILPGVN